MEKRVHHKLQVIVIICSFWVFEIVYLWVPVGRECQSETGILLPQVVPGISGGPFWGTWSWSDPPGDFLCSSTMEWSPIVRVKCNIGFGFQKERFTQHLLLSVSIYVWKLKEVPSNTTIVPCILLDLTTDIHSQSQSIWGSLPRSIVAVAQSYRGSVGTLLLLSRPVFTTITEIFALDIKLQRVFTKYWATIIAAVPCLFHLILPILPK